VNCPICDRDNDLDARRCRSCGADFEDPEVAAQLDRPRPDEGPDGEIDLSGGRYLGVRWLGLEAGGDLRRLALVGGALFAGCALLPVKLGFGDAQASWSAMSHGPKLALALPFVLAALGLTLGLVGRKLPSAVIAGALTAAGAALLLFGLTPMGDHAGTATRVQWLPWFGTAIAAAGVAIRVLRRRDPNARWIIVGGAVMVALGMLLPQADLGRSLPAEFPLYLKDVRLADASLLTTWTDAFDHDVTIKFLSMWHLLELALLGGAVVLAMMASKGPWDSTGLPLRPVGFGLIFYLPLTLTFYTLNVVGWKAADYVYWNGHGHATSDFTGALFAGRARLALLSLPATVWLVAGLVGLYATVVAPRLADRST
jgi:hypothetical protein